MQHRFFVESLRAPTSVHAMPPEFETNASYQTSRTTLGYVSGKSLWRSLPPRRPVITMGTLT
jgi:hypothetical protein